MLTENIREIHHRSRDADVTGPTEIDLDHLGLKGLRNDLEPGIAQGYVHSQFGLPSLQKVRQFW